MATETQNGRARVWGIRNDGTAISITGFVSTIESAKIDVKHDKETLKDENGFTNCIIWADGMKTLTLSFSPSATTRAEAEDECVVVAAGAAITITHFAVDEFNGTWINDGDQSIDLSQKSGKVTLKLMQYLDEEQNTLLATTAS